MKKLIALGLAACMTFSLAGCSGSTSKETEAASAAETTAAASAAASDTATSIDKLTVTYVTSPLNVPTIIAGSKSLCLVSTGSKLCILNRNAELFLEDSLVFFDDGRYV